MRDGCCAHGWEALSGDPLPWLLRGHRPNLQWRAAVELFGRAIESPAVRRAQGAASAAQPVASLIEELHPDGSWATSVPAWARYAGPEWRFIAAVQWGADPFDPRLHAAADRLLDDAGAGEGVAEIAGVRPSLPLTARAVQALAELGCCRDPRFLELLAWLEHETSPWESDVSAGCAVTSVAVLATLQSCATLRRPALLGRATAVLMQYLERGAVGGSRRLGFPNLLRTDLGEVLWAFARAKVPFDRGMAHPLRSVQRMQGEEGRWPRRHPVPRTLPLSEADRPRPGSPSRWLTMRAVVAITAYAVDAELPRLFPVKQGRAGAAH